ncbi:enoyl-CoA hydratase/isomerase family protein [Streptomyces phaeochromogenes]|uniref:enoyl-CoA hydratase/isomerase family protein n=1 Tax=Streptomyces phaeochromogenes TaxID=1923 RepID=UPI0022551812|nr:enoyl-CoA hydratase/isomerase family protein [Streptomyces phaeochromogenes]MCX5602335.1 enoyl-CoA hydratase/isomerase family protein [Streptomyces phaeochromogenes]WSJ10749.1 enoyl-CoA hydratase/isomerase family protein [Streptomyces phaeochromogenes]
MTDPADLVVTSHGPVRLIELNRPEQLNAMSEELHSGLASVWDTLADDPEARVVVLTGRGRAFSAGGNFDIMTRVQRDRAFRERNVDEARQIITGMVRCPLPVIAAVNGPAVGLGCSLALLSDLVLIADDAYIADPHVQVGLVAGDGGALVLPLLVGLTRAKELLFLGDRVGAEEAVRLGIANRVVPKDKLLDEAMDLARRLAALPVRALRETKRAVNLHLEQAMHSVLEPALLAERDTMHDPDHIAVVEKIIASRGRRRAVEKG